MRELMTTSEAADALGISQKRVCDLINAETLEAEKIAGIWFINADSVTERKRSVKKKGGRPKAGEGRFEESYTLYNREFPCIELVYDASEKRFKKIGGILDEKHSPSWLFDRHGALPLSTFNAWWRGRGIPDERNNLADILEEEGVSVPEELIMKNLGLSLSDQYWLLPKNSRLKWQNINFFNNDFENRGVVAKTSELLSQAHPNNTSDGNLEKFWSIERKKRVLWKAGGRLAQEPRNELIATKFFESALNASDYVQYTIEKHKGRLWSKCENFLNDDEEFVSAYYILASEKLPQQQNDYQHYVSLCKELGVFGIEEFLSKMIVCDYALMNHDRHFRNFGLVRNVRNLTWRIAPLFDTGSCLLCDVDDYDLQNRLYSFESKPFNKNPRRQLLLTEDVSWLNMRKLEELPNIITDVLSEDPTLKPRISEILSAVKHQIETIKFLA